MTQMMTEGPSPGAHTVPPEQQWAQPDQHWPSPEEQWTDWGRAQTPWSEGKPKPGFPKAAVFVPLGVLAALFVVAGLFLIVADPAGAAALCGGG